VKKLASIFAIAVIVPSLVLAWLALSALRDQEIVVQSQRAILHQTATDALASDLNTFMNDVRLYFQGVVGDLVDEKGAEKLSVTFDSELKSRWGQALVGCVVTDQGTILSPAADTTDPDAQEFLRYNRLFLSNKTRAEVYSTTSPVGNYIKTEEVAKPEPASENSVVSSLKIKKSRGAARVAPTPLVNSETLAGAVVEKSKGKDELKKVEPSAMAKAPLALAAEPKAIFKESAEKMNVAVANSKLRSQSASRRDFSSVNEYQSQQQQLRYQKDAQVETLDLKQEEMADVVADQVNSMPKPTAGARAMADSEPSMVGRGVVSPQKPRTVSPWVQIGNGEIAKNQQVMNNTVTNVLGNGINATPWSSLDVDNAGLNEIIGDQPEGAIARFLNNGLQVLLWVRHPDAPGKIFWAELDLQEIRERLSEIVAGAAFFQENNEDICLALLDSEVDVVAQTVGGFKTDWRRPFVASEVGEILPHWEVGAYWLDPDAMTKSAQAARITLWLLVPILLAAIGFGSFLIFRDVNREMFLARQKTDFVSNVSHELKTPLTSIRMFSDLLSVAKSIETEKRTEYSGIISREAARLTRLINNLLDFSRMDRGDRKYNFEKLDAVALAKETLENYRMHLEADGCELEFRNENGDSAWINGDRDALSQVLVNLLSNADKYACGGKEIILEIATPDSNSIAICVMDRGPGIRRKDAAKIFKKFFRADDSLATGIQGSGLGLTLARQITQGHGGDLNFRSRDGGGCCFTLTLPISTDPV